LRVSALVAVVALVLLAWGLALHSQNQREFTTTSPEAFALYERGSEQFDAFQFAAAEESLRRALELDPGFAMAEATLAVLLRSESPEILKPHVARAESLAALLSDDDERMLIQLRLAQFGLGSCKTDSLLTLLGKSKPKHPIVLSTRAMVAMARGEGDEAARIWQELLRQDPNQARAYNWLGYNAANMGRYDEALSYLHKYAYLAPDLANPHDSLGEILSYLGRYGEAEREFRLALEKQPDFFVSLINLARIYIEQGREHKGLDIIEQLSQQIAGTHWQKDVDKLLVQVFYTYDMHPQLEEATARFMTRYPEDRASLYYRAYTKLGQGEIEEAVAACDTFLAGVRAKLTGDDDDGGQQNLNRLQYTFEANLARAQGDAERAITCWENVLASSQNLPPHFQFVTRARYAEALLARQRWDEALAQTETILGINPRMLPALYLRVQALMGMQRYHEARTAQAALQAALAAADPDFPLVDKARELGERLSDHFDS
jgi:tetratricopeptide (TPR) repeat protein